MKSVILISAGDHAGVVVSVLNLLKEFNIIGVVGNDLIKTDFMGYQILGADDTVLKYDPRQVKLLNGVGCVKSDGIRKKIFEHFKERFYPFVSLIHPSVIMDSSIKVDEGVQFMAGVIIQSGVVIGHNVLLNTGAIIDHHCIIKKHVHIAPRAVLSGHVVVEESAHIGTGAVIKQGVCIGAGSTVGAGAVVVKDVVAGMTVVGVPARELKKK